MDCYNRDHTALERWFSAKEVHLRVHYRDPTGKVRDWESCERQTRPEGSDIDGVGIVAILEKPTGTEICFCLQNLAFSEDLG